MKFYLDEAISPKIAEILRKLGCDATSAHEMRMTGIADDEQLDFAAREGRCLVTFNRNDFIQLSRMYLDSNRSHCGVIVIPSSFKGNDFAGIAKALAVFASLYEHGLQAYTVIFLSAG